jgi:hypothetical protein
VAEETAARESIERRAVGVLATIAVVVTVLATLLSGQGLSNVRLGPWGTLLAAEAAVVLLFAGLYAWLTILPRGYSVAKVSELRRIVAGEGYWSADPRIGTRRAAESMVDALDSTRAANGRKAWTLLVAMGLELVAVAALVSAVIAYINRA